MGVSVVGIWTSLFCKHITFILIGKQLDFAIKKKTFPEEINFYTFVHFAQNMTNVGFVGPLTTRRWSCIYKLRTLLVPILSYLDKILWRLSEGHAIHEVLVARSISCLRLYAVLDHVEKNTITVSDFLDVARASFFKGNGGLHSK